MDTIFDKINKIYSKQTYFDQYNGSVLMTVLLCIFIYCSNIIRLRENIHYTD